MPCFLVRVGDEGTPPPEPDWEAGFSLVHLSEMLVALGTWEIVFSWTLCECGCVLNDEKVGL